MEIDSNQIQYLKGFLDSISYINTFDNDGKNYIIDVLPKVNDDFQDTLRKRFNVKKWKITTELITSDWRLYLKRKSRSYFDQIIEEVVRKTNKDLIYDSNGRYKENADQLLNEIKKDNVFYIDHLLQENFIRSLEKIVSSEPIFYEVQVDWRSSDERWYESYSHDFIFDLNDKILFLHFGGSD